MTDPAMYAEALEEIQRLRALGDALAGALELVTSDLHDPVGNRRALKVEGRYYLCSIAGPEAMEALAAPVHEWLVGSGMDVDDLRRAKASAAARVARAG